jgi:inner membrane protein
MNLFGLETLAPQWLWTIAAAALAIAEIVAPGLSLMWVGFAALVTAIATGAFALGVGPQFMLFAVTAFLSVFAARKLVARTEITTAAPNLNDRSARMIGEIVTAVEPVDSAHGRVKVGDSVWSAKGASAAIGERLRVVGVDGGVLLVEAV